MFKQKTSSNMINIKKLPTTRYMQPASFTDLQQKFIKYENAQELAKVCTFKKGDRTNCIIDGKFIFGDFIEAFVVHNNFHVKKMTISTLSMSNDNVDSLANLLDGNYIDQLDLIISGFHYSHKRHTIVRYTYEELDKDNKFQLAVADCHTKICIFETHSGEYIVIRGSANLVSSGCIEEFSVENDQQLYNFYDDYHSAIVDKFKTINKPVRGKEMWRAITETENK